MNDDINFAGMSSGMFNRPLRHLATFTIAKHPSNGCYLVHDDSDGGRLVGAGYASVEQAVRAYKSQDDRRTFL